MLIKLICSKSHVYKIVKELNRELAGQGYIDKMTDMEKKVMGWLCTKTVADTELYKTGKDVQNLIYWACLLEQIKEKIIQSAIWPKIIKNRAGLLRGSMGAVGTY